MAGQTSVTGRTSAASSGEALRSVVRRYGYGTIMLLCLLVLWWGAEGPYPIENVAIGLQIAMVLLVLGLEFLVPFRQTWGDLRNVTRADVIYFLLAAPLDQLQIVLLVGLLAQTAEYHQYLQVVDIWPSAAPVLLQVLLTALMHGRQRLAGGLAGNLGRDLAREFAGD